MLTVIERQSVDHWCRSFLSTLKSVASPHPSLVTRPSEPIEDALRALQASTRAPTASESIIASDEKRHTTTPPSRQELEGSVSARH
jgi:hypothetical protein